MSLPKKAVLVGINYSSIPGITLRGCINDVINMSHTLTDAFDYDINNITVLRDDIQNANLSPTRNNILSQLVNLVNQSANLSEIWFHYSGHGSQIRDTNADETDKLDEVIVPLDYQKNGFIVDDEIFNIIKNSKCRTVMLFDSCHNASICDLKWGFEYNNVTKAITKSINSGKQADNPNIFVFSGSKDTQTSADAYSIDAQQSVGAFTDTFLYCLRKNRVNVDIMKLYNDICVTIKSKGFTQTPILSCSSETPSFAFSRTTSSPTVNTKTIISSSSVNLSTTLKNIVFNEPIATTPQELSRDVVLDHLSNRRGIMGKLVFM